MNAIRTVLDHGGPCWHCSKRLYACDEKGRPTQKASFIQRGGSIAWVVEIDGYNRKLHKQCAEQLGFKA